MAGYRIFMANTHEEFLSTLGEIGITYQFLGSGSDYTEQYTFSDGKSVKIAQRGGKSKTNVLVIADDDGHFIGIGSGSYPQRQILPEKTDATNAWYFCAMSKGELVSQAGYDASFRDNYNILPREVNYSQDHKNDLILQQLIGNYYMSSSTTSYHYFDTLYVCNDRYFPQGSIVVDSEGNRYISLGWVLHKIGG